VVRKEGGCTMLEYLPQAIPKAVPHNQYTGKLAVNNITTALYLNKIRSQCSLVKKSLYFNKRRPLEDKFCSDTVTSEILFTAT